MLTVCQDIFLSGIFLFVCFHACKCAQKKKEIYLAICMF